MKKTESELRLQKYIKMLNGNDVKDSGLKLLNGEPTICTACNVKLKMNASRIKMKGIRKKNYKCPKCGQPYYMIEILPFDRVMITLEDTYGELEKIVNKVKNKIIWLINDEETVNIWREYGIKSGRPLNEDLIRNFDFEDESKLDELRWYIRGDLDSVLYHDEVVKAKNRSKYPESDCITFADLMQLSYKLTQALHTVKRKQR